MQAASSSKCHARDAQNVSLLLLNKSLEKTGTGLSSITFERCQCFTKDGLMIIHSVGIIRVRCFPPPHIKITEIWSPFRLQSVAYQSVLEHPAKNIWNN
jgi:hypothetical protein